MSFTGIARKLRLATTTVWDTVGRFFERSRDFAKLGRQRQRFKGFSDRLKRHLLYPPLLQDWAAFSIADRAEIVRRVWQENVSRSQLKRFYAANMVGFLTAKLRYRYAQLNRPQLDARRRQHALTLGNLITSRRAVIYMDETTFNV